MADGTIHQGVGFSIVQPEPPTAELSDDALALEFSERHAGSLLYIGEWGGWHVRDGGRWRSGAMSLATDFARKLCRDKAELVGASSTNQTQVKMQQAKALGSHRTITSVEKLARVDRRHARSPADFDRDPWVLNTPGGVLLLKTGELRAHQDGDMFTKVAGAVPGGDCPRWLRFMEEVCDGDDSLARYLQRFAGYTLTGAVTEHAFIFIEGAGANGKSVLVNTLVAAMGDYALTAMPDLFIQTRNEQHATQYAHLRGARMVCTHETEAGQVLAEARIKRMTGGDTITARVMNGDPFSFMPEFKLWGVSNHRLTLRNPDPAMRRRLNLVPFRFTPPHPDPGLPAALLDELPGILAWTVEGCLEWQREGLNPPPVVQRATDEYFDTQDLLAAWIADRCELGIQHAAAADALYRDWTTWMNARGEDPGTVTQFGPKLALRHTKKRTSHGIQYQGVKLLEGR